MNLNDLKETDAWQLYSQSQSYSRMMNMYTDTDKNFRMFNGDQWAGLKVVGVEKVQLNFIRPIVRYKVGTINQNLWGIHFSSENFENREFLETANKVCKLLDKKANKIWEKDNMDNKIRRISKNAAINDECPCYSFYDKKDKTIINKILSKVDIYYGNENNSDIQSQPYILLKERLPVLNTIMLAEKLGVKKDDLELIIGDQETFEESGEDAKYEKDNMCTVITKLYKKNGKVFYTKSTRYLEIKKETNSGLTLYPITHFLWEEKEGSARGEGEVRNLIPNQLEVNKTLMRRALVTKNTAFPQKVLNTEYITNPDAVNNVGATLRFKGKEVQDVNRVFGIVQPAQMSSDVEKLQRDLIDTSRALAGASDAAGGDIRPDEASGKAILAVQQASQQPLVEQLSGLKNFIEDLARIWLDMLIAYNQDGIKLEEEIINPNTGEKSVRLVDIPGSVIQELRASVKVDITPKSPYDKYAQELSLENLLKAGYFSPQMIGQLKIYAEALPDDSTMPKQSILEIIKKQEEEQRKIAEIQAKSQEMIQNANIFLNQDPEAQQSRISEAQQQMTVY